MAVPIDSRVSINNSCNDVQCCCCLWPKKNQEPKLTRSERRRMEADAKAFELAKKTELIKNRTDQTYD